MSEVKKMMKPTEMSKYLDKFIIGQTEAKKTLSTAIYNHYKNIIGGFHDKK